MKVNESTYENYFLLYIDNELTAEEKIAVETFVLANPTYATILNQLQQTKLAITDEIYEDKALLYRFDEMEAYLDSSFKQSLYRKEAAIIRPNFKKQYYAIAVSVAALFILIFGYQNFEYKKGLVIKQMNPALSKTEKENIVIGTEKVNTVLQGELTIKNIVQQSTAIKGNANTYFASKQEVLFGNTLPENDLVANVSTEVLAHENYTSAPITTSISEATTMEAINTAQQDVINEQAVEYNEIDTDDNDRVVFIASFEVDADKFRGITRKVGSLFKRNKTNKEK